MIKTIFITILSIFSISMFTCDSQDSNFSTKFKNISNRPYVEIKVNNQGPYLFMLDMGATGFGRIDSLLVDKLNLPLSGSTSNFDGISSSEENLVFVESLEFGPIRLSKQDLITRDYNSRIRSAKIFGILGADYFSKYVLSINYPDSIISLNNHSLSKSDKNTFSYSEDRFEVKLLIENKVINANIDSGSSLNMHFPKKLIEELNINYKETGVVKTGRRSYNTFDLIEVELANDIKIGDIVLSKQKIFISDLARDVNIGSGFLKDYIITFDQKNKLIKIENPKNRNK